MLDCNLFLLKLEQKAGLECVKFVYASSLQAGVGPSLANAFKGKASSLQLFVERARPDCSTHILAIGLG